MLFKTAFFVFSTDESNFLIYKKKPQSFHCSFFDQIFMNFCAAVTMDIL